MNMRVPLKVAIHHSESSLGDQMKRRRSASLDESGPLPVPAPWKAPKPVCTCTRFRASAYMTVMVVRPATAQSCTPSRCSSSPSLLTEAASWLVSSSLLTANEGSASCCIPALSSGPAGEIRLRRTSDSFTLSLFWRRPLAGLSWRWTKLSISGSSFFDIARLKSRLLLIPFCEPCSEFARAWWPSISLCGVSMSLSGRSRPVISKANSSSSSSSPMQKSQSTSATPQQSAAARMAKSHRLSSIMAPAKQCRRGCRLAQAARAPPAVRLG
mmetsp:Transcript_6931/g.19494  ORF Transcript_6931/g.19494 Transcript_6931/m.19494 type:complete len:270 (+) Transcript_6931:990-1799(+)